MRTTVDLPPALHRRVSALARARGQSLSATLAELTARGLNQLNEPLTVSVDERSGFPVVQVGRRITSEDVAAALDHE
jgi:predicted transcriptional regulator